MDVSTPAAKPLWRRFVGPALILGLMAVGYGLGLHKYLTLEAIAANRSALQTHTDQHLFLALGLFMLIYVAAVALSFPGASVLTILAGLLFGWLTGGVAVVISATIGAVILFKIVNTSFGDVLVKKAGPLLSRINAGFAADAFNYLLFLRLVPAFPFWLVNIAPALANVKLRTFALATLIGIIPGTFAFAFVGEGLDSLIVAQTTSHDACVAAKGASACPFELSVSSLITKELLIAFAVLGMVSLIPVALKKWKNAHAV
jgi:uncharacterized membrane protein YdjX (TVP38/TMEM64 family)